MSKNDQYTKNVITAVPFLLLTIVPFVYIAYALSLNVSVKLIALGALGWWLALLLRLPVILSVKKLPQAKARTFVTLASGPAEEVVRLMLLLVIGLSTRNAYLVGLGWAAIEVVYGIIQGFGMATLRQRTDSKAREAKEMLAAMGMDRTLDASAPYWGIVERLGANAFHISLSLLLVVNPYFIIVTAPVHSLVNLVFTRLLGRSLALAETAFLALGFALFVLGIFLT